MFEFDVIQELQCILTSGTSAASYLKYKICIASKRNIILCGNFYQTGLDPHLKCTISFVFKKASFESHPSKQNYWIAVARVQCTLSG